MLSVLLMGLLLASTGCRQAPHTVSFAAPGDTLFTASADERAAALALLDALRQERMMAAFEALTTRGFTQRSRAEALAPDGAVTAFRTYTIRFPAAATASPTVLRADSSGIFPSSWLGRFAPARAPTDRPPNFGRYALPEDPAYLAPRTREAFRYRLRPDTTLGGRRVRVVAIHPQPGADGADQVVRHARLYIDPATDQLVGLYLLRADATLLFREESRSVLFLTPGPDGAWLPHEVRFRIRVKMPLRAAQSYRLHASFDDYAAAS